MADQQVLTNLCSICHTKAQKYRCPRCSARTCSLPCYKRHQQWAQCSGKRDPTVYIKRSKLVTPAGVDHDYNFIAGVERAFDGAERQLEESGLQAGNLTVKAQKRENALRSAISRNEIIVEKAPLGMTRQKRNRTHWLPRSKCIEWTIEWIHEDKSIYIDQIKDDTPLWQAHFWLIRRHSRESKKRKRDNVQIKEPDDGEFENVCDNSPSKSDQLEAEEKMAPIVTSPAEVQLEEQPRSKGEPGNYEESSQIPLEEDSLERSDSTMCEAITAAKPGTADNAGNHYYLVKPRTRCTQKVLIPLSPFDTLSKCLHRQVILEFPSIEVLSKPPSELPSNYILENDYLGKFKTEQVDLKHSDCQIKDHNQ